MVVQVAQEHLPVFQVQALLTLEAAVVVALLLVARVVLEAVEMAL
jgi:hypothetical protein